MDLISSSIMNEISIICDGFCDENVGRFEMQEVQCIIGIYQHKSLTC